VQDDTQNVHKRRQGDTQEKQDTVQIAVQDGAQNVHQDVHQGSILKIENIHKEIFNKIKNNPNVKLAELANELGISLSTIKRYIKSMNNIKYIGRGYSGHWEIVENKYIAFGIKIFSNPKTK
jgi:ATP-dependent DNA helicase RecG